MIQITEGETMAKQSEPTDSVYKVVEIIGTSTKSWEDATKNAVETAAGKLRDLRIAEVAKLDVTIEDGKVQFYRARVLLSFKYGS
jgi:flavin-binding protein dodecin